MEYKPFPKLTKFIQDNGDSSSSKGLGESVMLSGDGSWNFETRKRSATFIESHILVSHSLLSACLITTARSKIKQLSSLGVITYT